jgi:hypothetical protein
VLGQVRFHFIAAGQSALDLLLDRQSGLFAIERQNLIDGVEQFLRLAWRDLDLGLLCGGRLRGRSLGGGSWIEGRALLSDWL